MNSSDPLPIRLIVGLGNPGDKYVATRHNAGFWFLDLLAHRHGGDFRADSKFLGQVCRISVNGHECRLLKPATYMNRSGQSVSSLCNYYKISPQELLVAHDELDLPSGAVRLKQGGGHAGHNGLRNTISALGEREFWRLRVGIGRPDDSSQVVDYVLSRPSREDSAAIESACTAAARYLPEILAGELQRAMHGLHTLN